ncbi:DUF4429 domain-containing protein, partial [Streptomyces smaragdinus]|uniref:DUF4429 domain-containing protein n=1 Tax=Streptomyces smaragdinus TaxID=2585196 RepID=UPI001E5963C0
MSRETDSPPPGGDAPYPPGTPPLPTRDGQRAGADAPGADDGPRTETTLTTRIRINIPGSRPIPPVVVRTPVEGGAPEEGQPAEDRGAAASAAAPGGPSGSPGSSGTSGASGSGGEKASDWFAPRKGSDERPPAGGPPPRHDAAPPVPDTPRFDGPRDTPPAPDAPAESTPPFGTQHDTPPSESTLRMPPVRTDGHGFAADDPTNSSPVRPSGPTSGPATGGFRLPPLHFKAYDAKASFDGTAVSFRWFWTGASSAKWKAGDQTFAV